MRIDKRLKKKGEKMPDSENVSILRRTFDFLSRFKLFVRHSAGTLTWETKSYEIWLMLQNLLYLLKPKTLLEFGSGRSTNYLAEYALKFGAKFISVEEHLYYCFKVNLTLKLSFLPSGIVKYAPIKKGWYSVKKLNKVLPAIGTVDFLFVDGPTTVGYGHRKNIAFYEHILPLLNNVKIIIIDDVHRPDSDDMANKLMQMLNLKRYDIKYREKNELCFLLNSESFQKLDKLPLYLRELLILKN